MEIKVKYLSHLIQMLLDRTGEQRGKKSFQIIASQIGIANENYLYDKIANRIKRLAPNESIKLHNSSIEKTLKFLGFENINAFINAVDFPINPQLEKCIGNYYSYVRRSLGDGSLFRSPVQIFQRDHTVFIKLKGKRLGYEGIISLRHGCLFAPLESKEGKGFYHIYHIGRSERPEILQGIFSGVSNTFEPIGGRAILVRMEIGFDDLENEEMEISKLHCSESQIERRLAEYFNDFSKNNLTIERAYAFDIRDLGTCK